MTLCALHKHDWSALPCICLLPNIILTPALVLLAPGQTLHKQAMHELHRLPSLQASITLFSRSPPSPHPPQTRCTSTRV